VFDAVAETGTVTVPEGFSVYTLEADPPDAVVVTTDAQGEVTGHHLLQTGPSGTA